MVTLVGAATVMISPITPWIMGLTIFGLTLFGLGVAVLIWWLLRNW